MKKGSKHSEESKEKMAKGHTGLKHDQRTKDLISQSNTKGTPYNEQNNDKQQPISDTTENDG